MKKSCSHKCKHGKIPDDAICVDYVVVGFGSAGSVLARYLSEPDQCGNFTTSVAVIEWGINRTEDPVVFLGPMDTFLTQPSATIDPKYAITQTMNMTGQTTDLIAYANYSGGRMWFGSSAHDGMAAVRGPGDVWDQYAQVTGNPIWAYNGGNGPVVGFMRFLEKYNPAPGAPVSNQRGTNGSLPVTQFPLPGGIVPDTDPFVQAIKAAVPNMESKPDYNVSPEGDIGIFTGQNYTDSNFTRRTYGIDFLPPSILGPDGYSRDGRLLRVLSGSNVNRILFDGNRAIGVLYTDSEGRSQTIYVRKEVILTAGTTASAAILQRSGIGSANTIVVTNGMLNPELNGKETYPGLNDLGIPVVVDNPNVGKGLKTHFGVFTLSQGQFDLTQIGATFIGFFDGSPFFAPAGAGDGVRRIETIFIDFSVIPDMILVALGLPPPTFGPFITGLWGNYRPKSVGTSYIVDKNASVLPQIRVNPYTDAGIGLAANLADPGSDLNLAIASFKIAKEIADNFGQPLIYPPPQDFVGPDADIKLARDALAQLKASELLVPYHYTGTCNMGKSIESGAVVDGELRVFGVQNVRVADNSVYFEPEVGNTRWSAMVAGLLCAQFLRPDLNLSA